MVIIKPIDPQSLTSHLILAEAREECFAFLDRLVASLSSQEDPFASSGEIFVGALLDNQLIAVGGLSCDPYGAGSDTGRIRHLYVRPAWRMSGIGRSIVEHLLIHGRKHFSSVRLRTDRLDASAFYTALGFSKIDETNATHIVRFE